MCHEFLERIIACNVWCGLGHGPLIPALREVEEGESRVQNHPKLQKVFEASVRYIKSCPTFPWSPSEIPQSWAL